LARLKPFYDVVWFMVPYVTTLINKNGEVSVRELPCVECEAN
jgi:hypothetical protein